MLNAVIVGCGTIGKGHARAYQGCREIRLAGVTDIEGDRAAALAKEHDVPAYGSLEEVLGRSDVDVVDVCVPSGTHGDIAIAAAKAGKHCVSEKPLDVTPQRCDEIIAAFDQAGTVLGGIYQHRYADDVRKTKAAIEAGRLGKVTLATCLTPWWRAQEYYDSGEWRGTWELDGGGALMNQSIHAIDLLTWLVGPVKTITARTALLAHERIEVEDVAVSICEFENGALGVINGTTAAYPGSGVRHEIMGTDGTVFFVSDKMHTWKLRDEQERDAAPAAEATGEKAGAASDPTVLSDNLFTRNLDDVARAAREGGEPCVTGREAKRAVEIICAIYESARRGGPVEFPLKEFRP